jgi:hypothetical protein
MLFIMVVRMKAQSLHDAQCMVAGNWMPEVDATSTTSCIDQGRSQVGQVYVVYAVILVGPVFHVHILV